jgi:ANTAR domain
VAASAAVTLSWCSVESWLSPSPAAVPRGTLPTRYRLVPHARAASAASCRYQRMVVGRSGSQAGARSGGGRLACPQRGRIFDLVVCRRGVQMTESRSEVVWGLVAGHAATQNRRVSVADVCAVAVRSAQVSGAWVAAASGRGPDFAMCVTDQVGERLVELQLVLGEGPCHDLLTRAAPVLAADLDEAQFSRRWPAFTPEARRLGVGAVFTFPLTIGAIRAGVMGLYRSSPGPLAGSQFGDGLLLADTATVLLLDSLGDGANEGAQPAEGMMLDGQSPDLVLHRAEIDQATGMLTVQLGVTAAEAFVRLRAYAYAQDRRLADVAGDIVTRRLRLAPDPPLGSEP